MKILNYFADFVLSPATIEDQKKFCDKILQEKPDHVFLNLAWESFYKFNSNMLHIDEFLFGQGIPTTWLLSDCVENNPLWKRHLKCSVIFIDFMLWRVYNEIIVKKTNDINLKWNPDATRYLFLTGKPYKPQRIGLLYQLSHRRLLDNCDYSFFMSPGMYEKSKKILPHLSTQEFDNFIQQHQRNVDGIEPDMQETSMHYGGIPYDAKIYSNTKFRLISETSLHSKSPFITEKTYLTIVNKNPFVIAGDYLACKKLNGMGIETFDLLFDIPSYDNIPIYYMRVLHVINHVEQWTAGNFNKNQVADMVEHNFNKFIELGNNLKENFENSQKISIDHVCSSGANHVDMSTRW